MQSQQLTEFYKAYLAWVEAGAPEDDGQLLTRNVGLCTNLALFCEFAHEVPDYELEQQFRDAGLSVFYPFNGSSAQYRQEKHAGTCHLNEKRIAWVRKHAAV